MRTPQEHRIAELEAENARLRAELASLRGDGRQKSKRAAYDARRNVLMARGQWNPYVPAGPVRARIRHVMHAAGMSCAQFAAAAEVHEGTVTKILYAECERVRAPVAAKIRKVTTETPVPELGWADPAGPARRLQALALAGWSVTVLAERSGMDEGNIRKIRDGDRVRLNGATARQVRALYDDLWNTPPPEGNRAEKIAAAKTRVFAAKHGWVPAGAWDDDQIDNPDASPAEGWQRRGRLSGAELAAEARELARFGLTREQAAERLGVALNTLEKTLSRHPAITGSGEAA